ncbi:hypothetical protein [Streptomyces sp. NPDC018059]|uniref:hypothetical protein n=1 Tax=Streptomyces sp. NPDC018059 TaxID=3365041 RepID=UPI0037ADFDCF
MNDASLADDLHAVRITTEGVRAGVTLNGHDVTSSLSGYTLEHRVNQPPLLVLYAHPKSQDAVFDGYTQVAVASERPPAEVIVAFLAGIDPVRLQQAALDRDDLDGSPTELTTAMLHQLAAWAGGAST